MANYLTSAYSLRIKKIYTNIKDDIPKQLKGGVLKNRKRITKFMIDPVKKAYTEGVRFAEAYSDKIDNKTRAIISDKDKKILFGIFIARIKSAELILKVKMENQNKILKLEKTRFKKDGSQTEQIRKEYINGIKTASNNLILNAGRRGSRQVWTA